MKEMMHDRPTVAGWWWWRKKGEWLMVEVHECPSGLYCPCLNMADSKANGNLGYGLWLGVWAGPLTPPPVPTGQQAQGTGQQAAVGARGYRGGSGA